MKVNRGVRRQGFVQSTALLFFCIIMLVMSWEGQKVDASILSERIPEQSIRLRILANSDSIGDQLVKGQVRDAVVEQMNEWVETLEHPQSLEEARQVVGAHLSEIERRVQETLERQGKNYDYKVELGVVPFPTKMYGGAVYPAGDYEAVRVTLGSGQGKNWWCVLFPPLCFVDLGTGDALAKDGSGDQAQVASVGEGATNGADQAPEVRFFLWDMLQSLWSWISGLFA